MTRDKTRFALAILAILIGGGVIATLALVEVPEGNVDPLLLALGLVLAWGGTVFNFYFGTSQSSADKTDMLAHRPTGEPDDPVHVEEDR